MPQVRMDIESVVVGNGPVSSMLVLRPRDAKGETAGKQLPIRIGVVERGWREERAAHDA